VPPGRKWAQAEDATRLARVRYQGGATGYLEVLTTDCSLYSVQLNLVNARQGEAVTVVQLSVRSAVARDSADFRTPIPD